MWGVGCSPLFMPQFDARVRVFSGVPLDRSLEHTIWFHGGGVDGKQLRVRQRDFFARYYLQHEYEGYQHQRVTEGVVQVKGTSETMDDANYIAISNGNPDNGSERWHYGFIDRVEYVNSRVTQVYYTLDPLQCYQDAVAFGESYIERSHIPVGHEDDEIGANLQPDDFNLGGYVYSTVREINQDIIRAPQYVETPYDNPENPDAKTAYIDGWNFMLATVDTAVHPYALMGMPIKIEKFRTFVELNDKIAQLNKDGKTDEIVSMYMCPQAFVRNNAIFNGGYGESVYISAAEEFRMPVKLDGYTPRHNKLYTYPYNFVTISNNAGNWMEWHYEDGILGGVHDGETKPKPNTPETSFRYRVIGSPLPGSKPMLVPAAYPQGEDDKSTSMPYCLGITLPPLPSIPIASDSYQIWLAQNQGSNAVANMATAQNAVSSIAGGIASAGVAMAAGYGLGGLLGVARDTSAIASLGGGVMNAIMGAKQNQAKYTDAKAMPNHARGLDSGDLQYGCSKYTFTMMQTCVRREIAESIDEFWIRFGYPINKMLTPEPGRMPRYTYIKAPDVNVYTRQLSESQGVPQWVMDGWKKAFANGITFWKYSAVMNNDTSYGIYHYGGNGR